CNLCGINLSNSRFNFAYLIETDLSNADLSGARMAEMTLDRAI
ncbi:MAG: pentapeptide repeat-containing protein, partial [Nostocaceae cyanobacterium]|nr:pentapeptide repeat-containing protein [Nostocaceae cyanobacterium]